MPDYMFVYHGGKRPETPEEGAKVMAAWGKWMEDNAASLKDPGNPVGVSKTVSPSGVADGGGENPTSGYSMITAPDMDAACQIAKSNPMLADGGSVEVAEIMPM
jgi:hypothetical protein